MKEGLLLSVLVALAAARLKRAGMQAPGTQMITYEWSTPADVIFVLDGSDWVSRSDFDKMVQFTRQVAHRLNIQPGQIQMGLVTYGSSVQNQFYLNQFNTIQGVDGALSQLLPPGGRTETASAIHFAATTGFNSQHGGRAGVPHVIVHVGVGPSNNLAFTETEARQAREQGVTLYSVGVGPGMSQQEMTSVASAPSQRYVMQASSADSLSTLVEPLARRIASEVPLMTTYLPSPSAPLQKGDLVFMVDTSSDLGHDDFQNLATFLKSAIAKLPVSADGVRVGIMQYGTHPSQDVPLAMFSDRASLLKAIDAMTPVGGGRNTADAINYLRQFALGPQVVREGVPHIGVVVTNGPASSTLNTITAADAARTQGLGLVAVGVGPRVTDTELHNIANSPALAQKVGSYTALTDSNVVDRVLTAASKIAAPPPKSTGTGGTGSDNCVDKLPNCQSYDANVCRDYKDWAQQNCKLHCQFCSPLHTTAPPPCRDTVSNCELYQKDVCTSFGQWAVENCRQFCGFCDTGLTFSGFYGQCFYNGKSYRQGERWSDGCDYDCQCVDAAHGKYQCYNKCPIYKDLPPTCTLVASPGSCCLQPVCNFNQKVTTFQGSGLGTTSTGISVCEYMGQQYYQDQTWQVGCDFKCTCIDSSRGAYRCQSYCPTYSSLPGECHLQKEVGDCCSKPVCNFYQQTGSFTGTGTISGKGVGVQPTAAGPCVDKLTNCPQYGKDACTGDFVAWAKENCKQFCGYCDQDKLIPSDARCVHQGKMYEQGARWSEGCDTECVCEQATYGYYRCFSRCPVYGDLPSGCYASKKAGECCDSVTCDHGTFVSSTTNLQAMGNGQGISVNGQPVVPTGSTNPNFGNTLQGCLYKGQLYVQDQLWQDGCDQTCVCTNGNTGVYMCRQRCPTYTGVPSQCSMVTSRTDACCHEPSCPPGVSYIPQPNFQTPTMTDGKVRPPSYTDLLNGLYTVKYNLNFQGTTPPRPTAGVNSGGGIGYCDYKGTHYQHGEKWIDGCEYNCVCEDASIGKWTCISRCQKYGDLPQPCILMPDPKDSCCQVPNCTFIGVQGTHQGQGTHPPVTNINTPQPTPPPTTAAPKMCVYKGQQYGQGQQWYDGCNFRCSCDDAVHGFYRCMTRCPEYFNVPKDSCHLEPDPSDPSCCSIPKCTFVPSINSTTGQGVPTAPPGQFSGTGNKQGGPIGYCEYKGQRYKEGQTWDDGCEYTCTCKDEDDGLYECADKCARFTGLPPQCTLVTDFANPCCKKPSCNFQGTMTQTSGQGHLTPAPTSHPGQTPAPIPSCDYKGVEYFQGQTWNDGCDKACRCEDALQGLYVCDDRCPKFPNMPAQCSLVTDPQDSCCRVPECHFVPTGSQISGTLAPNLLPTPAPGKISGSLPTPTPGPDGKTPTPINRCVYKGQEYRQGQTWEDGCDYTCVCEDEMTGKYECTEKCTRYSGLPPQCQLVKDPANPCCRVPDCTFQPVTNTISGLGNPTPSPGSHVTPSPGTHVNPTPGVNQTPIPGQTNPPLNPTPQVNPTPGMTNVCVYRGVSYTQGQTWYDGCEYKCVCEDSDNGVYRCTNRCPSYDALPAGCTLEADSRDPLCCKVPKCVPLPGQTAVPTPPTGSVTGGSVIPTPRPQSIPSVGPGQTPAPTPSPVYRNVCVYKGRSYTSGQRWQDGCDYDCVCLDDMTGQYKCTEKCARFDDLPAQCRLVQDISNPCCKRPICDIPGTNTNISGHGNPTPGPNGTPTPGPNGTPTPGPNGHPTPGPNGFPTPAPQKFCLYQGVPYRQGQTWEDGCDLKCTCEDENMNVYRCDQRCARYDSVPAGCTMVTDPRDSCCRLPSCQPVMQPMPTPGPGQTPAPSPGATQTPLPNGQTPTPGSNQTPIPNPNPTRFPLPIPTAIPGIITGQTVNKPDKNHPDTIKKCVYHGRSYSTGEQWTDGCDYFCQCLDEDEGKYKCVERCPVYTNIPSYCVLAADPHDTCCRKPLCTEPVTRPPPLATLPPGQTPLPGQTLVPTPGSHVTPGPGQTFAPGMNPTPGSNVTPTPANVCVYKGASYVQGQQWYDGCDKKCVCENGMTDYYTCTDRCARFDNVPAQCTMVADPSDPQCCTVPQCAPTPGPFGFPTPPAGVSPTPTIVTNVPGVVTGKAPTPTPGPDGKTPTPRAMCVYKGRTYRQGQQWQDGCDYNCVCDNEMTGEYKCNERCATYPFVPPGCSLSRDTKDFCCYVMQCDFSKPTPNPYVTPAPQPTQTPLPNGQTPLPGHTQTPLPNGQTPLPGHTQTPLPNGQTPLPGHTQAPLPGQTLAPTPGGTQAPVLNFCVYNGIPFRQGQTWDEGCEKRCRCDDASTNYYTCFDRCASYPNTDPTCTLVIDPNDACCRVPACSPTPFPINTPTPAPGVNPTPNPGINPTPAPSPLPTRIPPGTIIGKSPNTNPLTNQGYCLYKGQRYTKGQKWDDGCDYVCECVDDKSGQYACNEKCPKYTNVPSYCVLVQDSAEPCCQTTYCPSLQPTPQPNQTPQPGQTNVPNPLNTQTPNPLTPQPGTLAPGQTPIPGSHNTPVPHTQQPPLPRDVCVYNGRTYTQGQQWFDGCDKKCVCENGMTGFYRCNERCPTYPVVAPNCIMVPDPSDPQCCQAPDCRQPNSTAPTGIQGSIVGSGTPPTMPPTLTPIPGSHQNPTPGPGQTPTPGPGQTPTPGPGQTPVPNPNQTPAPRNVCVYKGRTYSTGQRWQDGCDYDCVCLDDMTGQYKCTERCPKYPNLPPTCVMVRDPSDPCCQKPDCSPATPSPGLTPSPGSLLTPNPNQTPNPFLLPTLQPLTQYCVYQGVPYRQGQTWQLGCDKICRCEDGMSGQVNCDDRCPVYPKLESGCRLVTDPADQCCQVPQCSKPDTNNPDRLVKGTPGVITGQSLQPGNPNTFLGRTNVCVYHGRAYQQGEKWQDGCQYDCECIDAMDGKYRCMERCARFPSVPASCTLITDARDSCCQVPYCPQLQPPTPGPLFTPVPGTNVSPTPGIGQTPVPQTGQTPTPGTGQTPSPGTGQTPSPLNPLTPQPQYVCVYKGSTYRENQVWYDGCDSLCKCENETTGFYRCQSRCGDYPSVPPGCMLVPDPQDPSCCQVPSCPLVPPGATPTPGVFRPSVTPPSVTGYARPPTPNPALVPTPGPGQTPLPGVTPAPGHTPAPTPTPRGCLYKGMLHRQGDTWQDGCEYQCACLDDMSGQYKCTERCVRVPQLPMQCVLVTDPQDSCCQVPFCDYLNPTPFPHGVPTPNPTLTPSLGPTLYPGQIPQTPRPSSAANTNNVQKTGFCVYKGVYYRQGESWNDGCDLLCTCDDSMTGFYTCRERCQSFDTVPAGCVLKTSPLDQCCLVPDCSQTVFPQTGTGPSGTKSPFNPLTQYPTMTGTNVTPGINVTPGTGPGISGTAPPIGVTTGPGFNGTSSPFSYLVPQVPSGTFTGQGPSIYPGVLGSSSGFGGRCVYKAHQYSQGEKWDDGCSYRCECIDAMRGKYRCSDMCPQYYYLPPQCSYVTDPQNPCCKLAQCVPPGMVTPSPPAHVTPSPGATASPNTPSNVTPIVITIQPTIGPGVTGFHSQPPLVTDFHVFTGTPPPGMCAYMDGKFYRQGETWSDGCDVSCTCDNAATNVYRCTQRCPTFADLPPYCTLVVDPADACCKKPSCVINGQVLTPLVGTGGATQSPTLPPDVINVIPLGTHNVFFGNQRPPTMVITSSMGGRDACIYNGMVYKPGQSWDDGCDLTCTCVPDKAGLFKCVDKCPRYPPVPQHCNYVSVPGQCCPSLTCNVPQVGNYVPVPQINPSPTPMPGQVTPAPISQLLVPGAFGTTGSGSNLPGGGSVIPSGFTGSLVGQCVYQNKVYNIGESWEDGCDFTCKCLESRSGYYECKPKCPVFDQSKLPNQCYMVRPTGECCAKPVCQSPDGSTVNPLTPTSLYPVYGSFSGGFSGTRPGFAPEGSYGAFSGQTGGCIYKGQVYTQGQQWQDGCEFNCECMDGDKGMYRCTPRCTTYTQLPSVCHLVRAADGCCNDVSCDTAPTSPGGTPQVVGTALPGVDCSGDKLPNCYDYEETSCRDPYLQWAKDNCPIRCGFCPGKSTPAPDCKDKLPNCESYGKSACGGDFVKWAKENCIKYCDLCPKPTQPPVQCADKLTNCKDYGMYVCQAPYESWSRENCPNYCGVCGQTQGPLAGATADPSWTILMKGVAGVPGDLYQLWSSPNTENANVPAAAYLTAQYPGHYKPDLSNHWTDCKFEKIKVAIFNGGVEKANVIFDAQGTDKMDWFKPERIISSTWNDIRNLPKSFFSMAGDATTGREFYAASGTSGCNGQVWLMVSTRTDCPDETADKAPAFHYALGNSAAMLGQSNLASGDVFAILSQGGLCGNSNHTIRPSHGTFVSSSDVCIYKNKIYQQSETWLDGCDYNCTCENAASGFYRCRDLCPTYTNLPQGCQMVKANGECCAKPSCDINGNKCFYKGQSYSQGQTWDDGCDYKCTCVDGNKGFYQCQTKCLVLNLPPQCNMLQPPPGKCCPVPSCPSNVHILFPPGYVQE